MANEFSRKESVSDYEIYQGREGSQLNFQEEASKIVTGVNAIATEREGKKAKIQTDTDDVIAQLEKADSFQNQTLGQTVLLAAKGLKETLLMQSKLMKKGKIKPADFMATLQTAKDDMANWGIAAKDWNEKFKVSESRQKLDPKTNKIIASGMETAIKESTLAFNNLNNVVPFTSATGNSYLVRLNEDGSMPDFETQKDRYGSFNNMNNLLLYQDDNSKYDLTSLIANEKKNVGAFITSTISGYTIEAGGNIVVTREGAREMEDALKGKEGGTNFTKMVDTLKGSILSDNLSIANILVNESFGDDGYIIAQTEQEFVDKGGKDLSKWIEADYSSQPPSVTLKDGQKTAAEGFVEDKILIQFGQKTTKTKGLSGQQLSAASQTTSKIDTKIGGYAAQLADVLTGDTANAENIVRSLIIDINDNKKDDTSDIVDFDINDDTIIFYKDGEDPISVPRRSTTGEIDDPTTPENEAYNDVDLINEITGLYKSLTGEAANRTQIEEGLKEVKYDLSGKKKRSGRLAGGAPRAAYDLITENQKVNAGGDTVLSLLDDAFDGTTGGVVDWLKGDDAAEESINEIMQKALKSGVKKNIKRSNLGNAKTKLFADADADKILNEYIAELDAKDPTGKLSQDFKTGPYANRGVGEEVVMINIAGTSTPILLDQNLSKQKMAELITEAINNGIQAVNKERESTDAKRKAGGRPSVNLIQAKNPQKTGESAALYKARIMKMWTDKKTTP
jgi:hypothetical protein